jgi:hypothetical protein
MSVDVRGVLAWIRLYPFRTWLVFALVIILSLIVGIIRSSSTPPSRAARVNAEASQSPTANTVTAQVTDTGLTLNHPGGASLSIPPGALPVGTTVAITKGSASVLDRLGALQPDQVSWDVAASVEPPSIPVTLTIPYDPGKVPSGAQPLVTTYDELSGWWVPVRTSVAPETHRLIAELPGFSLKTWIIDRTPDSGAAKVGTASWLEYEGQQLLTSRPSKPQCAGRSAPPWVKQVVVNVDQNADVSACVRAQGDGFAVETASNHSYPIALSSDMPFTRVDASALDDTIDGLMQRLSEGTGGRRALLLPTGTTAMEFDPPPTPVGTVEVKVRRDGDALLRWLVFEIIQETPAAQVRIGPAAVDCGVRVLTKPVTAEAMVDSFLTCVGAALESELRSQGFNVDRDLWRSVGVSRLPAEVTQMIGALRWIRGLQVGRFSQLASQLLATGSSTRVKNDVATVRWAGAPRWVRPASLPPLFSLRPTVVADGASGQHLSSLLAGQTYTDATGAWVNCGASPATLTYTLDKKFDRLAAVVGLANFAPADLAARFQFVADGKVIATLQVSQQNSALLNLDVKRVKTLVISTQRTAGTCPLSTLPFGALGDATLFPS